VQSCGDSWDSVGKSVVAVPVRAMATATMGLRRRVQVGSSTSVGPSGGGKRSRSENNNSPSQGNLNSPGTEPVPKKSRGPSSSAGARTAAAKAKELELAKKAAMPSPGPPHWSDPRPYASIAGLSLQAQAALCPDAVGLPSPMSYMSTSMATFVGTATNLGKSPSVSYLDISNMTARPPGWPSDEPKSPMSLAFAAGAFGPKPKETGGQSGGRLALAEAQGTKLAQVSLPESFPNDSMFGAYQPWVIKTYGDLAKTKTITIRKYARILRTLRGEEVNSAENSKFRFWVKSKGFHIGQPEGYEPKPADRIIGRHAVSNPGLDPPLYVPTQPPHNKVSAEVLCNSRQLSCRRRRRRRRRLYRLYRLYRRSPTNSPLPPPLLGFSHGIPLTTATTVPPRHPPQQANTLGLSATNARTFTPTSNYSACLGPPPTIARLGHIIRCTRGVEKRGPTAQSCP
jgi:hypothetical protein